MVRTMGRVHVCKRVYVKVVSRACGVFAEDAIILKMNSAETRIGPWWVGVTGRLLEKRFRAASLPIFIWKKAFASTF